MRHLPHAMLSAPRAMRFALCAMLLLLSATACYNLCLRLTSQLHYLRAKNCHREGYYGLAAAHLEKAGHNQPGDFRIWKALGDVYHELTKGESLAKETLRYARKAKAAYVQAGQLNPLDAESAYGLARAESRLEQIYPYLHPEDKNSPYDALPYFKKAIELRPHGILYHYALARYLYQYGQNEQLVSVIRSLARTYPAACNDLKRESFWSPQIKEAVKHGLEQAIQEDITPDSAHKALSSLLAEDKAWAEAITHYQQAALHDRRSDNAERDEIHLGYLYLKNGQLQDAETRFYHAMDLSQSREKDLESLYHLYKNEGYLDEFYPFYQRLNQRMVLSPEMDILLARHFIDLKRYEEARQVLTGMNHTRPTAEGYYWLSRLAEMEKDWDRMELAIQKATVLEPSNNRYRQIFFGVLRRLGKLETAEREIGLVIENSEKSSPQLFSERAQIRRIRKDYLGAVEDWKSAIRLAPRKASFYAQAAEAYIELGDWIHALTYYEKATKLEPENKRYAKRYLELEAGNS